MDGVAYYRQLFYDLSELSKELKYSKELTYFYEYVDFYIYLFEYHEDILFHEDAYYYLDDLNIHLKEVAETYIANSNYGGYSMQKDIPHIHVPIEDVLFVLSINSGREAVDEVSHDVSKNGTQATHLDLEAVTQLAKNVIDIKDYLILPTDREVSEKEQIKNKSNNAMLSIQTSKGQ